MIQFVNLKAQYLTIKDEIDQAIQTAIDEVSFVGGKYAEIFEEEFASFIGAKHCIACANGTDSLEILLQAMGVGAGDEVLVPALTWISTAEAVSSLGAVPVFVDIDPDFYTIDLNKITEKITKRTKVIIPVHLYGQPVDMPKLMKIAQDHNILVLEDCAQAHGAEYEGQKIGSFGDCASFSFYPGKNLGAYGDAGGMVTNNDEIAQIARRIANHGQEGRHNHVSEGRNSRMDGIQAAILGVKLKYLNKWTESRINNGKLYSKLLESNENVNCPKILPNGKHVFHLFVIRTNQRDLILEFMKEKGVECSIHYPVALPFLTCYQSKGAIPADFPVANRIQNEILSLPMYAELTEEEIIYITSTLNSYEY